MGIPYAELVGDPVVRSKSPLIHRFWLEKLGLSGDYRAVRLTPRELPAYLESRRRDPFWRGCNVTSPLKQKAAGLVGDPTHVCSWLDAVNAILPSPLHCLIGANTDVAGLAAALSEVAVEGERVCLIGAGGGARAALCYLFQRRVGPVSILCRDARKADALCRLLPRSASTGLEPLPFDRADAAMAGARLIVNATPMGRCQGPPMRPEILDALEAAGAGLTLLDMVYDPLETAFLRAGREAGGACLDGLTMLVGQAAPAFELFFGVPAPRGDDAELRGRLLA
jgi:shikimate dehydrogenase